jgi:PTS system nitrogen regulatory IIA component
MKLSDFVVPDAIIPDLKASTKEAAIREVVESLRLAGQIPDKEVESVIRAIMKREELGSTGIGYGVALPHTRHPSVTRPIGTVAISRQGVEFDSIDGEPVYIIFLVISPMDRPGDHLRALDRASRQLRNETFRRFLRQSQTKDQILELLEEADEKEFPA